MAESKNGWSFSVIFLTVSCLAPPFPGQSLYPLEDLVPYPLRRKFSFAFSSLEVYLIAT